MRQIVLIPGNAVGAFSDGEVAWASRSGSGIKSGTLASLVDVAELALCEDDEVTVAVPGADVVLHGASIPARSDAQARIAASFALEDDIAVDREELHFALGPPAGEGWNRNIALVASSKMDEWLASLKSAGIAPNALLPDFLLLAAEDATLTLVEQGDRILARAGENSGFSVEIDFLPYLLPELLKRFDIRTVNISSKNAEALLPPDIRESRNVNIAPALGAETFAEFALANLGSAAELNLLQGAYAPRRAVWKGLEIWKRAAGLAAALCIAYVGLLAVEGWRYAREARRIETRAEEVLMAAFPDIERVVNPRAQMRARLNETGTGDPDRFFDLATMVYAAAEPLETLEVQGLQFDHLRGDLAVDVAFHAYPDLEALKRAVFESGGSVEEGGSRQQGGVIVGEIRVAAR